MLGRKERGSPGDGNFNPQTGGGYVSAKVADYAHAIGLHHEVVVLLFETFGGFGDQVREPNCGGPPTGGSRGTSCVRKSRVRSDF